MINIAPYSENDSARWDELIHRCPTATFLHSRRFLSYHGDFFKDASVLLYSDKNKLCALFPAAISKDNPKEIISHPGATYGGLLSVNGWGKGNNTLLALEKIIDYYRQMGFCRLTYKAVPHIFHRRPQQDDLYALFRLGFRQNRVDLSCVIDLQHQGKISADRKWSRNKACQSGIKIIPVPHSDTPTLEVKHVWQTIYDNLQAMHHAAPTHSLAQLQLLIDRFPDNIFLRAGVVDGSIVCGGIFFTDNLFCHAQYLAVNDKGRKIRALDALIPDTIAEIASRQFRWFSFGISTEKAGAVLNDSLYNFKAGFGGGGIIHPFYVLDMHNDEHKGEK